MVFAAMNHRQARRRIHESIEYLLAHRLDARIAKRLFNDRNNDGNGLRSTDQRIPKLARMHLHRRYFTTGIANGIAKIALSEGLELWP